MTLKELSQLYHLNREIKQEEERLTRLQAAAMRTTAGTNMPRSGVSDRTGIAVDIAECKRIISERHRRAIALRVELERYISGIDDSLTRQIFTLRFIDGASWTVVADRTGSSEYAVKHICYRYLKQH